MRISTTVLDVTLQVHLYQCAFLLAGYLLYLALLNSWSALTKRFRRRPSADQAPPPQPGTQPCAVPAVSFIVVAPADTGGPRETKTLVSTNSQQNILVDEADLAPPLESEPMVCRLFSQTPIIIFSLKA